MPSWNTGGVLSDFKGRASVTVGGVAGCYGYPLKLRPPVLQVGAYGPTATGEGAHDGNAREAWQQQEAAGRLTRSAQQIRRFRRGRMPRDVQEQLGRFLCRSLTACFGISSKHAMTPAYLSF